MAISYAKLNNGTWGIRAQGVQVSAGDQVMVLTKAGVAKPERVAKIVWSAADGSVMLAAIEPKTTGTTGPKAYKPNPSQFAGHEADATEFETYSQKNAARVNAAFASCGCVAYTSVFTVNRWDAQGYRVAPGQAPVQVQTMRPKFDDPADKQKVTGWVWTLTPLFCSHQVVKAVKG